MASGSETGPSWPQALRLVRHGSESWIWSVMALSLGSGPGAWSRSLVLEHGLGAWSRSQGLGTSIRPGEDQGLGTSIRPGEDQGGPCRYARVDHAGMPGWTTSGMPWWMTPETPPWVHLSHATCSPPLPPHRPCSQLQLGVGLIRVTSSH